MIESAAPSAPAVVPVLNPGAEAAAPVARKTRFGLPRRFQTPVAAPAATPEASAPPETPETPVMSALAEEAPEPAASQELGEGLAQAEEPRRYRFDRQRATPSAAQRRAPKRLRAPVAEITPAPVRETSATAPGMTLDLPSIEELAERARAAEPRGELPPLRFVAQRLPPLSLSAARPRAQRRGGGSARRSG